MQKRGFQSARVYCAKISWKRHIFRLIKSTVADASKSRAVAIGKEANKQDGKMEIQQIDDEITRLVRMGTHLIREKKECMAATGVSAKRKFGNARPTRVESGTGQEECKGGRVASNG